MQLNFDLAIVQLRAIFETCDHRSHGATEATSFGRSYLQPPKTASHKLLLEPSCGNLATALTLSAVSIAIQVTCLASQAGLPQLDWVPCTGHALARTSLHPP